MSLLRGKLECRVCQQQDELLVGIYDIVEELEVDLCSLLESCGDIKVEHNDEGPKYLCQVCTNELLIAAKFRRKCSEAEMRFRADARAHLRELVPFEVGEPPVAKEIITFGTSDYYEALPSADKDGEVELVAATTRNCEHCGAVFHQSASLRRHIEKVHSLLDIYDCEKCGRFYTDPASYRSHICSDPVQSGHHRCSQCGKGLQSRSSLASHLRVHSGERPFACDVCSKTFRTKGALVTHRRRHQQLPQHMCPHCDRGFLEASNLRRHIAARHTNERPHTCTVCNRSFSRVFLLQLHSRTHTGERPYACEQCDRRFSQLGVLRSHERIHTGDRLHRCPVCEKTFSRAGQLRRHEMRHETWE